MNPVSSIVWVPGPSQERKGLAADNHTADKGHPGCHYTTVYIKFCPSVCAWLTSMRWLEAIRPEAKKYGISGLGRYTRQPTDMDSCGPSHDKVSWFKRTAGQNYILVYTYIRWPGERKSDFLVSMLSTDASRRRSCRITGNLNATMPWSYIAQGVQEYGSFTHNVCMGSYCSVVLLSLMCGVVVVETVNKHVS